MLLLKQTNECQAQFKSVKSVLWKEANDYQKVLIITPFKNSNNKRNLTLKKKTLRHVNRWVSSLCLEKKIFENLFLVRSSNKTEQPFFRSVARQLYLFNALAIIKEQAPWNCLFCFIFRHLIFHFHLTISDLNCSRFVFTLGLKTEWGTHILL